MIILRNKEFSKEDLSKFRSKYGIEYNEDDDNENSLRKELYEKSGKIPLRAFKNKEKVSYSGATEISRAKTQELKDHFEGKESKSDEEIVTSAKKHAKNKGRIIGGSVGSLAGAGAGMLLSKGKKPNWIKAGIGAVAGGTVLGHSAGKKFEKSAKKDIDELLTRRNAATDEYKKLKSKK